MKITLLERLLLLRSEDDTTFHRIRDVFYVNDSTNKKKSHLWNENNLIYLKQEHTR